MSSWGIFKIRANEAWSLGYTGEGVRIAVLDTGVDITHPLQISVNPMFQRLEDLSSRLDEIGVKNEEGLAGLSGYVLATIALSIIILALLGYIGFIKK
ncbi:hypothetical protein [Thermosphaera aggregans]|uniref:hypothetical protein n=1 Tax=Thermosphaera aggregans TaxID=54254 RepID=UPI0011E520B3|nr:hypothetical protein [Thermosphaera aggregans]